MGGATTMTTTEQPPSTGAPLTQETSPVSEYEAVLTGVVALAQLFATCIEAFGLISPNHKWEREEQLLLSRLGLQQARLLIWGDVVGVCSPPASVTDRAVPKHPSAAYPDLKEPTFFGPRDARLDEMETRQQVERALSALVDRTSSATREEMMAQYGLRPPKKGGLEYSSPVDMNRLEAFRERYELLKEVAESYAHLNVRRNRSLLSSTSWQIADYGKFDSYLKLTQEKIDFLIDFFDAKDRIDRGMRMDIKALGWHLTADKARVALDVSKLKLIKDHCSTEYPEYVEATDIALANIERERKENVGVYNPYAGVSTFQSSVPKAVKSPKSPKSPRVSMSAAANGMANGGTPEKHKRNSLFGGLLKGFGKKSRDSTHASRSKSVSAASPGQQGGKDDDAQRALSDVGPLRSGSEDSMGGGLSPMRSKSVGGDPYDLSHFRTQEQAPDDDVDMSGPPVDRFRSKSIGDVLEIRPEYGEDGEEVRERLERLVTGDGDGGGGGGGVLKKTDSAISRHDQYHGIARQGTRGQSLQAKASASSPPRPSPPARSPPRDKGVVLVENGLRLSCKQEEQQLLRSLQTLDPSHKATFYALHEGSRKHASRGMRIYKARAFDDEQGTAWVHFGISRFNHSCVPNAEVAREEREGSQPVVSAVYAIRDIQAGEEIGINYHAYLNGWTRGQRQKMLRVNYGFEGGCACCAAGNGEVRVSHAWRRVIHHLSWTLRGMVPPGLRELDRLFMAEMAEQSEGNDSPAAAAAALAAAEDGDLTELLLSRLQAAWLVVVLASVKPVKLWQFKAADAWRRARGAAKGGPREFPSWKMQVEATDSLPAIDFVLRNIAKNPKLPDGSAVESFAMKLSEVTHGGLNGLCAKPLSRAQCVAELRKQKE